MTPERLEEIGHELMAIGYYESHREDAVKLQEIAVELFNTVLRLLGEEQRGEE